MSGESNEDRILHDVQRKIEREKIIIQGAQSVKNSTSNLSVQQKCDSNIREAQRNIAYLEETMRQLEIRIANENNKNNTGTSNDSQDASNSGHQHSVSDASTLSNNSASDAGSSKKSISSDKTVETEHHPLPAVPAKVRPNYTRLDLIKYDTPYLGPRIQLMLQQLEFKLSVEKQYKEGIEKMQKLYQIEGDRRSRAEAETKRIESTNKIQLLKKALKRYSDMHIDIEEDLGEDDESMSAPNMRRPLSGNLHIACLGIKDVDHVAISGRFARTPDSMVTIKVEDQTRARTRYSRNERWMEDFDIPVDKASEIEIVVYDRSGDHDVPVGLMWLRISDIAEALRRKKVENEIKNNQEKWVSAANLQGEASGGVDSHVGGVPGGLTGGSAVGGGMSTSTSSGTVGGAPGSALTVTSNNVLTVDAWFVLEPVGQIRLVLGFEKTNRGLKRGYDGINGLGRQGAIRQKKEEVHEVHGHKFVQHQFYNIMRCALCGEFLKYSAGFQCQDCRLTCHKKCYQKVVTKCISKASTEADPDEEKLNHRIPHRFGPTINMSANWCCHCGYILPLGKKNVRKCSECGLTCHPQCAHLVPDFCGMSMEVANQILSEIKSTKIRKQAAASQQEQRNLYQQKKPPQALSPKVAPYNLPSKNLPFGAAPPPPPKKEPVRRKEVGSTGVPTGIRPVSQQLQYDRRSSESEAVSPVMPRPSSPLPQTPEVQVRAASPQLQAALPGISPASQIQSPPTPPQPQLQQQPPQELEQQQLDVSLAVPSTAVVFHHQQEVQQLTSSVPMEVDSSEQTLTATRLSVQTPPPIAVPVKAKKPRRKIGLDDFNFVAVLGKGNFGKVMLAESKGSRQLYAIKVLKKDFIIENDEVESTRSEKRIFLIANRERHPFLINLHSCFQTENRVYFVMEYISGGDLMWHIQKELFTPRRAQFYAAEVLLALKYFHDNGVIYRDLKLDNIMLTPYGHIKIADYGLCKEDMWYGSTTGTFCGTPDFMAPEILLEQRYGRAVDWWAFGVLIYQMLLGKSPFRGEDDDEVFDAILSDEPLYPIHMPRNSVSILQALLTRDPERRLGSGPKDAEDVMSHPYFENVNFDDIYHCRVAPPFVPKIDSPTDVSNFDREFTSESPALTPVNSVLTSAMQEQFRGFSYLSGDAI